MGRPQALVMQTNIVETIARKARDTKGNAMPPMEPPTGSTLENNKQHGPHKCQAYIVSPVQSPGAWGPTDSPPMPPEGKRTLCISLCRLLQDDKSMVEFNHMLSSSVRCKTALRTIGGGKSANAAQNYLIKYNSKNPSKLAEVPPLIQATRQISVRYPPVAADTGTEHI